MTAVLFCVHVYCWVLLTLKPESGVFLTINSLVYFFDMTAAVQQHDCCMLVMIIDGE